VDTALTATTALQQRRDDIWLLCAQAEEFWPHLEQLQTHWQTVPPQDVLLAEPDPVRFLAAFFAACPHSRRVWLANPRWGLQEWRQVAAQCQPEVILGNVPGQVWGDRAAHADTTPLQNPSQPRGDPQILIPTGGSSGQVKFAVHTWDTLTASVQGFQQHFQCATVNAYCVLPLFHVSGLMQAMRCLLSGGQLAIQSFPDLSNTAAIAPLPQPAFLSLVPTQLQRLLNRDRDFIPWLQSFTAILLGGAPPWPSLLEQARRLRLPLAPTYGMTETAAQVATLLPTEFLAGRTSSGRALPHAHITIRDDAGQPLPPGQTGRIAIAATSLAQGYWQRPLICPFESGDLGVLDAAGYLSVLGRTTTLIITGGEKVLPEEVEAAILKTGLAQDAAVVGVADEDWGEQVVAVVVSERWDWSKDRLGPALKPLLSSYKIPKHWLVRPDLPRNPSGKLDRAALQRWATAQLQSTVATSAATPASGDAAAE